MTNPYKAEFVLTPGQAVQQAAATAQTYLARALRIVAETNHLPHIPGIPNSNPLKYPEIVGAVVQAQSLDYLAWSVSEELKSVATALESIARALESR